MHGRRSHFTCAFALIVAGLTAALAGADGFIVIHDPPPILPPHPHPPMRPHYRFAPLEVKYHHVTTRITDQVAVTEIDQAFYNPNPQQLEGTYLFPIPVGARIDKFAMDINGQPVEAELLDADKARRLYEDIVRKARDPALLEYAGQGLFKVRIFPIEPRSEKRIQLKYTELLRSDSGMVQYLYPLNTEKFSAAPLKSVSIKVELACQQPIKTLYSPSHAVEIQRHGDKRAVVGFEARDLKPDTDFQLFFAPDNAADVGLSLLTFNDGQESDGGYFLLLVSPSAQMSGEQIAAKDVVFVLDTSGSMAERNKIDQAKKALRFCLKNLNERDRFEIVRFATETQPLFEKLVAVNETNLAQAEEFIDKLKPIGGTAIEEALLEALAAARAQGERDRPYFVVFLTDGQPTVGATNEDQILAAVTKTLGDRSIRIFCFGIGTDVNTHLLDKLAERTRAVSQYVLPDEDIEIKVSNFYAKISQPVLANLKLTAGGGIRLAKLHPGDLPDLFRGEQLIVLGRYTGSGDTAVTLDGTVNGQPRSFSYDAKFASQAAQHDFIPRLWATRRVGYLLDEIRLHGESKELRDEVTALARQYGIVTPYTAYLILEDETRRGVPALRRTLQVIEQDERARAGVDRMYGEAQAARSGDAAVGGAQALGALKDARTATAPSAANVYAIRGQRGAVAAEGARVQQALLAQQTRHVRGRTFYQNGTQWIDAEVPLRAQAAPVMVKFNSDEYFALLAKHPDAAQWLALGTNVQLVLAGTVYEVTE
ncbi:MAG: VIT and VWA domain-containing protein [Planctomycetota bacterium]